MDLGDGGGAELGGAGVELGLNRPRMPPAQAVTMGRYATGDGAAAPRVERALTASAGGLLHRSAAVAEFWNPTRSAASAAARLT